MYFANLKKRALLNIWQLSRKLSDAEDEASVQIMNQAGRKNTSTSYMWIYRTGKPDRQAIL